MFGFFKGAVVRAGAKKAQQGKPGLLARKFAAEGRRVKEEKRKPPPKGDSSK